MAEFPPRGDRGDDGQPNAAEREAWRRNPLARHGHRMPKSSRRLETGTIVFIVIAVVFVVVAFIVPAIF